MLLHDIMFIVFGGLHWLLDSAVPHGSSEQGIHVEETRTVVTHAVFFRVKGYAAVWCTRSEPYLFDNAIILFPVPVEAQLTDPLKVIGIGAADLAQLLDHVSGMHLNGDQSHHLWCRSQKDLEPVGSSQDVTAQKTNLCQ